MRHLFAGLFCCLFVVSSASAQEWAKKMFTDTSHDFGTVAKGAKAEFRFKFENKYVEDLHVTGFRSSCGCTIVECPKTSLKTFETGEIIATFNTSGAFAGARHATLTVTFDKPFHAEIQLNITGTIRSDVSFLPAFVDLGETSRGEGVQKKVTVNYNGGRSDWKIKDVLCTNTNFEVEVNPLGRNGGSATYDLIVRLKKETPTGAIKDQLLIVTSEGNGIQVPVSVEGTVLADVTVKPSSVFMGIAQTGQTLTKQIVVTAKKPFIVTDVQCDDTCFSCKLPQEKKMMHLIPITYTAGETEGKIAKKIRVTTDISDEAAEVLISAQVTNPVTTAATAQASPNPPATLTGGTNLPK